MDKDKESPANQSVYTNVSEKLADGMTPGEFKEMKGLVVAGQSTVEDLVEANIASGNIREIDGRLTTTSRKATVKLSRDQHQRLQEKSRSTGKPITNILEKVIDRALSGDS